MAPVADNKRRTLRGTRIWFCTAASSFVVICSRSNLNPKNLAELSSRSRCRTSRQNPDGGSQRKVSSSSKKFQCRAVNRDLSRHSSYSFPGVESQVTPLPMPHWASPLRLSITTVRIATLNLARRVGVIYPMEPVYTSLAERSIWAMIFMVSRLGAPVTEAQGNNDSMILEKAASVDPCTVDVICNTDGYRSTSKACALAPILICRSV